MPHVKFFDVHFDHEVEVGQAVLGDNNTVTISFIPKDASMGPVIEQGYYWGARKYLPSDGVDFLVNLHKAYCGERFRATTVLD